MNKSIKKHTAGILLNQLSDHLPCFTLLETDIAHNSKTKFTRIFKQNDDVIRETGGNCKMFHINAPYVEHVFY